MNWLAFTISALTTTLIAAIMFVMPSITQPTIPLGVNVPHGRVREPVIAAAVRRYRGGIVAAFVAGLIAAVVLAIFTVVAAALVPPLLVLALGLTAYLLARRGIQRAKRDGAWYDGVPVRLSADIRPDLESRAPVQSAWYLGGLLLLLATAGVGVAVYPSLPDPLPIHWNAAGVANGFADKSWLSVFGPCLIGVGMLVLLYAIALAVRLAPTRGRTAGTAERVHGQQRAMQGLLGQLALATTLEFCGITLIGWLTPGEGGLMLAATILLPVLLLAIIAVFVLRFSRSGARVADSDAADVPDDDSYWKAGGIYVNRNDPALMVPKRFGIGWTINFGHPAGAVILVAVVAVVVLVTVLATRH